LASPCVLFDAAPVSVRAWSRIPHALCEPSALVCQPGGLAESGRRSPGCCLSHQLQSIANTPPYVFAEFGFSLAFLPSRAPFRLAHHRFLGGGFHWDGRLHPTPPLPMNLQSPKVATACATACCENWLFLTTSLPGSGAQDAFDVRGILSQGERGGVRGNRTLQVPWQARRLLHYRRFF